MKGGAAGKREFPRRGGVARDRREGLGRSPTGLLYAGQVDPDQSREDTGKEKLPCAGRNFYRRGYDIMSKVTIIGAGNVGATIANDLATMGIASEIVLIDINKEKAFGEAMDIYQGVTFAYPAYVRSGDYEDAAGSDLVVITSGIARRPNQTRLDLIQTNTKIIKDITPQIVAHAPDAVYVIVSNPVDILTYVFHKISGIPESRIVGSGTALDTARLQAELGRRFHISPKNVHAYVYGEHGDSSFVPWSLARIANNTIEQHYNLVKGKEPFDWNGNYGEVEDFIRKSGAQVIKAKGATFYAVAMSVCHICKCILSGIGTSLTVSAMMHGEYGIDDVCLSTLAVVDDCGIRYKIINELTDDEVAKLRHSADCLKEVIKQIEI